MSPHRVSVPDRIRAKMAKYDPLSDWLIRQTSSSVDCSFSELHELVGGLPPSARAHAAWWGNDGHHVQVRAWLDAGFHVAQVNVSAERVSFKRGT